jgi:hypothetical protein
LVDVLLLKRKKSSFLEKAVIEEKVVEKGRNALGCRNLTLHRECGGTVHLFHRRF